MTRKKNEAQIARAQRMFHAGYAIGAIAKILHATETTVHMWVDEAYREKRLAQIKASQEKTRGKTYIRKPADDPKPEAPKPKPINWQPEIVDLRRRGFSKQAIAAQLRVPYRAVEEALR